MGRAGACLCARVSRGDRSRTCPLLCPLESSLRTGVLGSCHPWGSSSLRLRAPSPHCHLRQAAVPKFPCPSPREKLPLRSPCLLACARPRAPPSRCDRCDRQSRLEAKKPTRGLGHPTGLGKSLSLSHALVS